MPEWYKKRILQRPRQETQLITERPSETYQLELPDFKIPTVTNSEDSVMTGLTNRKWRDIWEHNGRVSGINNTDTSLQEEHPSLFLLPFAPEVMGSGLGLGVLKTLGGYAGSYVGSKIGNEVGYALDNTFNKQLFEPLGEIVGGFAGFGKGYNLFEKAGMQGALKYLSKTGKEIPHWFMRPELRTNVGRVNQRTFFAEDQTPKYNSNQIELVPVQAFASRGNPTNIDLNRYITLESILKDINEGKNHALGYLKSNRKANLDLYNKQLFKRRLRDKTPIEMELKIEENPYKRASTPMKKPNFHYNHQTDQWEGELQLADGKWIGTDKDGFFLSDLGGNEYGRTAIIGDTTKPNTDQMYLDKRFDLDDTAFHEYLHRGRIGNATDAVGNEFYRWKTKWLMKPTARPYLLKPEEAAANMLEIGRRNNIITMDYPGPIKAKQIIQNIINKDPVKGNMLNDTRWETKPKRVWNALRGEYIGLLPISIGLMNYDRPTNNTTNKEI